jgi:hypothetical protein
VASTEGGDWAHGDWRRLKAMLGPNGAAPTHQDQQTSTGPSFQLLTVATV